MKTTTKLLILVFCCFSISLAAFGQEEQNEKKRKNNPDKEKTEKVQEAEADAETTVEGEEEDSCIVLLPSLIGSYKGQCKKGLAHGKGTATGLDTYEGNFKRGYPHGDGIFQYSNGDLYNGQFKNGLKHGEGTLFTRSEEKDTTLTGLWVDDFFVGPKPLHPRVTYKYGVDGHSFKRERDGDRFLIEIMLNGMANADLQDFFIVSTSGTQMQMGRWLGFENVTFPVVCKVSYKTWNKLRTARHEVIFEFELPEPGEWRVRILN